MRAGAISRVADPASLAVSRFRDVTMSTLLFILSLWAAAPQPSVFETPWRWTTEQNREVTLAKWRGHTLIVAPFYTACRTRCPATIGKLRGIDAAYREGGKSAAIVLVTLDPATDTPGHLLAFKKSAKLPDSWTLLTGSAGDTRALARWLDARPAYDDGHIDHQVRIAVFDREGRLVRNLHGWDFEAAEAVVR